MKCRQMSLPAHLAILAAAVAGCTTSSDRADGSADDAEATAVATAETPHNTLTDEERAEGWRLLFDGESLAGWRGYESETPPEGWRAEDGTLHRFASGGDIMTVDEYEDFVLDLDWKISEGGNSGIFYRVMTGLPHIYTGAPEMQVLDDAHHPDGQNPLTSAGSVFGVYPAPRGIVRPAGEWNHAQIIVNGNDVEHWLNGRILVQYELGSPAWRRHVDDSKFADVPEYGAAKKGYIGLQDHGDEVWFRDIKLRELTDDEGA
ncbi:MAG: DUF1080 domain-containing protein [Gemmatimonadales bacterium]